MSEVAVILRDASRRVDRYGVPRAPKVSESETCLAIAVESSQIAFGFSNGRYYEAMRAMEMHLGVGDAIRWQDAQVSAAVIAAEMRNAADLADLIYPNGGVE